MMRTPTQAGWIDPGQPELVDWWYERPAETRLTLDPPHLSPGGCGTSRWVASSYPTNVHGLAVISAW